MIRFALVLGILLLAGCRPDKDAVIIAARDALHPCPPDSITYQSSSSNDGVAWFTARCDTQRVRK